MLFNSYVFLLLFLPIVFCGFFAFCRFKYYAWAKGWLIVASLYFYAYFSPPYLLIIITSILANYAISRWLFRLEEATPRRLLLALGCVLNLGILCYYKYTGFLVGNFNTLFSTNCQFGKDILLPLGISFYTFQQLSYIVDCYGRKCKKYDFLDYSLFVTFFPQLIAGPIVLPSEMLPQFDELSNKKINWENISAGLFFFACGLAKKCFLADTLAIIADTGYATTFPLRMGDAWFLSLAYTLQLYFDFSGYCDMAMGLGKMFNIELPLNFNSPYKATNFRDFWRRWHITLGRFMMNYLYIPLGGNRGSAFRTCLNLIVVFLLSGLWHGAGWLFLLWGGLHGVGIVIHRLWRKWMDRCHNGWALPNWLSILITFLCVNILWVFFRAKTLAQALRIIGNMFGSYSFKLNFSKPFRGALKNASILSRDFLKNTLVLALIIAFVLPNVPKLHEKLKDHPYIEAILTGLLFWLGFICISRMSPFLYFNF